jgi:nitrogen-specific signal transduction histidine kinase
LSLINKLGNEFDSNDLKLLTTAVEMIAVAIGNAHLYARTIALMDERERLHRQVIQTERLATVGRLTASLSHEINNPMQAIKGAMTLALEDLNDVPSLREYIQLSLDQSDRVVQLVNRMKEIYRPHSDAPELVNITHLLQEMLIVANKAISRQNVSVKTRLATMLPPVFGIANQLHLVFLSIALNLGDTLGNQGRTLWIITNSLPDLVQIQFVTSASHLPTPTVPTVNGEILTEASFGLAFSRDIVQAHGGSLRITRQDGQLLFTITLPTVQD